MWSSKLLKFSAAAVVSAGLIFAGPGGTAVGDAPAAAAHAASVSPDDAMQRLRDGNGRFVAEKMTKSHQDASRREELATGQHPFAVVLGCADSRVPPELVFDQGLGDLFVIRVAGEIASPDVIGSIEYAVEHLGCRTIIVLGHERCGAVDAALHTPAGSVPEGNLGELLKDIQPAIAKIDPKAPDAMDAAVIANAKAVAANLVTRSKELDEASHKGDIVITPARYDLETGKVEFFKPNAGAAGH
ncbi:MAG TPA: carbonic anhydrase [Tepidisphaeraceae bacterium]|jgi:carbonic anhydrase|nr:carbonic anhydrase [Tepidisphaeraceae bacterium]